MSDAGKQHIHPAPKYGPDEDGVCGAVRPVNGGGGVGGYRTNFATGSGERNTFDFLFDPGLRSKIISSALYVFK